MTFPGASVFIVAIRRGRIWQATSLAPSWVFFNSPAFYQTSLLVANLGMGPQTVDVWSGTENGLGRVTSRIERYDRKTHQMVNFTFTLSMHVCQGNLALSGGYFPGGEGEGYVYGLALGPPASFRKCKL